MGEDICKFLGSVMVEFSSLAIGWFSYCVFIDSIRYLAVAIASFFDAICGILLLWGNNLTVFVIRYAPVFGYAHGGL